jgi:hypothetical protein
MVGSHISDRLSRSSLSRDHCEGAHVVGANRRKPSGNGTAPSTLPTVAGAVVLPSLPSFTQGKGYMSAVLAEATNRLRNTNRLNPSPDCAQLFGTDGTQVAGFPDPSTVLAAIYSNVGPTFPGIANRVGGKRVSSTFVWAPVRHPVAFTLDTFLYISTSGIEIGPRVFINLSVWNGQGRDPSPGIDGFIGIEDMAATLLHEMGHVYTAIPGSGGSKITPHDLNNGGQ